VPTTVPSNPVDWSVSSPQLADGDERVPIEADGQFLNLVEGKPAKDAVAHPYPLTAAISVATRDAVRPGARPQ
jgi:hypothetical protein